MIAGSSPFEASALKTAVAASSATALAALVGGGVRLLPWLLDPAISFRVVLPFARGVGALALEAALLVGWPVGWALATVRFTERGEDRVLASLGERPARTILRLAPQAALLALALAFVSFAGARDAGEPGRVVNELIADARGACAHAVEPVAYTVPFAGATWLCWPGDPPRLVGHAPGALAGVAFTALGAQAAGDLRRFELTDARFVLGAGTKTTANVHAGVVTLHGLAPWARAANMPPWARALLLSLTALGAGAIAAYLTLRRAVRRRFAAIAVGAAGPLAALGMLRALERSDAAPAWSAVVPPIAMLAALGVALALSRLPRMVWTASK